MPEPAVVDAWTSLFRSLKELRAAWPARGWSWDRRLSCVTSSFAVEIDAAARAAAVAAFPSEWGVSSIQKAPASVRDAVERAGGIRSGQLVFSTAVSASVAAYCLWWPWGDGMTTSVRIGIGSASASQDLLQRLRDAFGVEL